MTNKFRSPLFCPWLLTFCSQNSIQSDPIKTNNRASLFSDQNRPVASSLNQEWKQKPSSWPPRSYAFCPITCSDFIPHFSPSRLTNYLALPGTHLAYFCFRNIWTQLLWLTSPSLKISMVIWNVVSQHTHMHIEWFFTWISLFLLSLFSCKFH